MLQRNFINTLWKEQKREARMLGSMMNQNPLMLKGNRFRKNPRKDARNQIKKPWFNYIRFQETIHLKEINSLAWIALLLKALIPEWISLIVPKHTSWVIYPLPSLILQSWIWLLPPLSATVTLPRFGIKEIMSERLAIKCELKLLN